MNPPKERYWTVTEQDVGRELGNPDWVDWASKRISELEGKLVKAQMASVILDEISVSITKNVSVSEASEIIYRLLNEWNEKKKQLQ